MFAIGRMFPTVLLAASLIFLGGIAHAQTATVTGEVEATDGDTVKVGNVPVAYRADKWERAAATSPRPGCPIKGNINGGNAIYHTPWSRYYSRVQIIESDGERWFCNEGEAAAAGWRPVRTR